MTARILSREPMEDFKPVTLTGHKRGLVGAWFGPQGAGDVYTVSSDGAMFHWLYNSVTRSV